MIASAAGDRTCDVAVVGAGPAGAATALLLAREGVRVTLLDRARLPRPKACAEYVNPGAVRTLTRLGLIDAIRGERPTVIRGMRVVSPDGTVTEGRFPTPGLALPRERLDAQLAAAAVHAGAALIDGTRLERLTWKPDRLILDARAGTTRVTIACGLLVGADGLNSRVAHRLGVARRPRRRRVALVGHATGVAGMTNVGEMHVAAGTYVGLADIGGGITTVALVADVARAEPTAPPDRWLARLIGRFPAVGARLDRAEWIPPVRAVGPFGRSTRHVVGDRVLLVGDAAEFFDPFTGEGVHAALRGAELAAQTIRLAFARGTFTRRSLMPYERARRRAFTGKWVVERGIGAVVDRPRVLDHVAHRMARRPELADALVGVTGGLVPPGRVLDPRFLWQLVR